VLTNPQCKKFLVTKHKKNSCRFLKNCRATSGDGGGETKVEHMFAVFVNRMLRRKFQPKRQKETEGWRKLHNEEFHNLYSSQNIIRLIKSRTLKWVEHLLHTMRSGMPINLWSKNLEV
jgi:hypothetical protein